jgi:NTE family protein
MSTPLRQALLDRYLSALLGELEPDARALLHSCVEWVELPGGATLMRQGEPGDSMYLTISGRLRAYVREEDGRERVVREMARGRVVGEMSLYTGEPRSATVVAIRDSVLVRLDKPAFHQLLARSARLSILMTRQVIERLRQVESHSPLARPVTIALVPITPGVDVPALAERLAVHLGRQARVCRVDAATIGEAQRRSGPAHGSDDDAVAMVLDELEATHEFVLLLADPQPGPWTEHCVRRCDEVLLLADATQPPALHPNETECLMRRAGRSEAAETLVLLHPARLRCPQHTRVWLGRRPVSGHVHIRPTLDRDLARLARLLAGTACGLVLAGGGARGLAHLGVWRALLAHRVEVDVVGGTSIGSVMAALVAMDRPLDEVMAVARQAFRHNPTGDLNPLPFLSLIKGLRLDHIVRQATQQLLGCSPDVEDLWKTYFCIASNYSQASEQVLRQGSLHRAMMASMAIPGALPPVLHDGDLLCDGGTLNNYPVDVMRGQRGVGRVIGVDLSARQPRRVDHEQLPGGWALLRDKLRPRRRRLYRLPSLLSYLMNVTVLYSNSRQRDGQRRTDLYFNPALQDVGMLQWRRFDEIVELGHAHARQRLDAMSDDELAPYRGDPAP